MEEKEEKLESNIEKRNREIQGIVDQLNEIKYPVSATVYSHEIKWSIRNVSFWKALKAKDDAFIKLINLEALS